MKLRAGTYSTDGSGVRKTAMISPCGQYRYSLLRVWDEDAPLALFIGLNPSTADATEDDPTIRRMMGFARSWDCGGIVVANLFAYRTKSPKEMMAADDPVGFKANLHLAMLARHITQDGGKVIAAWGAHGGYNNRDREVVDIVRDTGATLQCLGHTQGGFPKHPLYLKSDTALEDY